MRLHRLLAALLLLPFLAACGAQAATDEVPVQIGGGLGEDRDIKGCLPAGTREVFGAIGDNYIEIPVGQRTYRALSGDVAREQGPMTFTVNGVEMVTDVQVEYLVNADCERPSEDELAPLETFTRDFVVKFERNHGGEWFLALIREYIGRQTDQALDNGAALLSTGGTLPGPEGEPVEVEPFFANAPDPDGDGPLTKPVLDWRSVLSNAEVKDALEDLTGAEAQRLITETMGGERFCGPGSNVAAGECLPLKVTITPPKAVDPRYQDIIAREDIARGEVKIAQEQQAANAARVEADRIILDTYGPQGLIEQRRLDLMEKAIDSGKVTVLPVPDGANVTLPAPTR